MFEVRVGIGVWDWVRVGAGVWVGLDDVDEVGVGFEVRIRVGVWVWVGDGAGLWDWG